MPAPPPSPSANDPSSASISARIAQAALPQLCDVRVAVGGRRVTVPAAGGRDQGQRQRDNMKQRSHETSRRDRIGVPIVGQRRAGARARNARAQKRHCAPRRAGAVCERVPRGGCFQRDRAGRRGQGGGGRARATHACPERSRRARKSVDAPRPASGGAVCARSPRRGALGRLQIPQDLPGVARDLGPDDEREAGAPAPRFRRARCSRAGARRRGDSGARWRGPAAHSARGSRTAPPAARRAAGR